LDAETLRTAALASKAWPYEEARKLLKRWPDGKPGGEPMIFETGYGPSGLPHIGTFNEVLRTTFVRNAFHELTGGAPSRLIAFSDDMDGLRKVPDNVPNQAMLTEHLGKPLTQIPDPFGTHESFAHHNNAMLRRFLVVVGKRDEDDRRFAAGTSGATHAAIRSPAPQTCQAENRIGSYGWHHAPHIGEALCGRAVRRGVDHAHVRRERQRHANERVLPKRREIAGLIAVDPEVVGVDRPEQRIVRVRIVRSTQHEDAKPLLDRCGRELEFIGRHVAVGARATVAVQAVETPIDEGLEPSRRILIRGLRHRRRVPGTPGVDDRD